VTEAVDKKLREARFFLNGMRTQEQNAFGDKEPFDFKLSAFLSASMSVRDAINAVLNRLQNPALKGWMTKWIGQLSIEQAALYKFMGNDRRKEVHLGGSSRDVRQDEIKLATGGEYSDSSGNLAGAGSFVPGSGMGGASIYKPHYYFTIGSVERDVTGACAEYLTLLERMATQFKADIS
jgi:hypothetical protein